MNVGLRVLDLTLVVAGPKRTVGPLAAAYSRFRVDPAQLGPRAIPILADDFAGGGLEVDGRREPWIEGLDRAQHLYQRFLETLFDRLDDWALLHAAALLGDDGSACLLAAPSGHGKSSLTLELVQRGCGFLGDDYAPLDLERREVQPFPRRISIDPRGTAPVPERFRGALEDANADRLFGKVLLDVGELLGEEVIERSPARLGRVVLLSGEDRVEGWNPGLTELELVARQDAAVSLRRRFEGAEGVEVLDHRSGPQMSSWRLRLRHEARPTAEITDLLCSEGVVYCGKVWQSPPEFSGPPAASRILRREAALALGRELMNRRGTGGLLRRYGGREAELFLDLAAALRDADCWHVRVGKFRATVDLLEELVRGAPRGAE